MALTMTPTTAAAMSAVRADKAGVGSAVLNSMRQVGGSLGIAIMGAIVASSVRAGSPWATHGPAAFVNALHDAPSGGRGDRARRRGGRASSTVRKPVHAEAGAKPNLARRGLSRWPCARDPPAAEGRGTPAGRARHGLPRLLREELPRRHDRRDRARGGDHRADPVPPLRLEARPLPRLPRRGMADLPRVRRGRDREQSRRAASARSRTPTAPSARSSVWSTCGSRRSARPPRRR